MSDQTDSDLLMMIYETMKQLRNDVKESQINSNLEHQYRIAQIEKQHQEAMEQINIQRQEILENVQAKLAELSANPITGSNSEYAGRTFGLIMTLNEADYNDGKKADLEKEEPISEINIQFALTMSKDKQPYLNQAGLKLTLAEPNIENDVFQQFSFGQNEWNTVIDSVQQRGMVWDVANKYRLNSGIPFYLFMFHGGPNQRFIYKDNMIYSQQNGLVVTYVGGDDPFVVLPVDEKHKARQTFTIKLL